MPLFWSFCKARSNKNSTKGGGGSAMGLFSTKKKKKKPLYHLKSSKKHFKPNLFLTPQPMPGKLFGSQFYTATIKMLWHSYLTPTILMKYIFYRIMLPYASCTQMPCMLNFSLSSTFGTAS